MKQLYLWLFVCTTIVAQAQTVTHGPIVGGVTDTSARVFIRTSLSTQFTIEVSTISDFSSGVLSFTNTTDATKDTIAITAIAGLQADTKYYVRTLINSVPSGSVASFETFPATGVASHQVFVTGSCIYDLVDANASLFNQASGYHPKAFIQMGDWGYPDADNGTTDIYLNNPPKSFASDYATHQTFYKMRYQSPSHVGLLQSTSTDYMYDDHDYLNDNSADDAVSGFGLDIFGDLGAPKVYTQPPQARLNSIKAYLEWFPGYAVVDSVEGIYHSFRSGNTEIFVLDLRSMRTPQASAIKKINNQWVYSPPAGYTLLGANQMNWLKNGLANSTATWKIIISSDAFNLALRNTTDTCLKIGGGSVPYWAPDVQGFTLPNKGYTAVQNYADCWAGFHEDADTLVNFVINNNIKNVFMVSGDTHTVGLDDGTNSGIPELNSGNLKKANSMEWVTNQLFMNYNIWNKGGSGLCDANNFEQSFGKVEVFGNDSLRLSAHDAQGNEICGWTFMANEPYRYNPQHYINRIPKAVNDVVNTALNDTSVISVLANDSDAESDILYVNLKTTPAHGAVTVNNDNTITYVPSNGFTGTDTFNYTLCDHSNASCYNCSSARVTVNVGPNNVDVVESIKTLVYPNPAVDHFYVLLSKPSMMHVTLQSVLGEKVLESIIDNSEIFDLGTVASGQYVCVVADLKTNETHKFRLSVVK